MTTNIVTCTIARFIQKHENEIPGLFQDNSRTFFSFQGLNFIDFQSIFDGCFFFTQFSFEHRINPKEWKRIDVFYYFQGQFHISMDNLKKFQDNARTNGTILKFQEFSRTKVKFKDFSRSV